MSPHDREHDRGLSGLHSLLMIVGAFAAISSAAVVPGMEFAGLGVFVNGTAVPVWLLMPVVVLIGATAISHVHAFSRMTWRQRRSDRMGLLISMGVAVISLAGFWYGYRLPGSFMVFEYRPAMVLVLYMIGIVALARLLLNALDSWISVRFAPSLGGLAGPVALMGSTAAAVLGSASIAYFALDGMPHMVDAFTYLMQGRMLWHGHLTLDAPLYPELWVDNRHLHVVGDRMFGKYPLGWPFFLGMFDRVDWAWLANPALAGLVVVILYYAVRDRTDSSLARLSVVVLALSPGFYWHASTHLSHTASALWLLLFAFLYQRMWDSRQSSYGLLAGIALGCAIMTRPQDALFFALPVMAISAWLFFRAPSTWFRPMFAVVLGTLPGLALYLGLNDYLMGNWAMSPYGDTPVDELTGHVRSGGGIGADPLFWLHESWVGLTREWFAGAFTAAIPVVAGLWFGRVYIARLPVLFSGALSLMLMYGFVKFGSRTWAGPRWYVPLIPVGAVAIAAGLVVAIRKVREGGESSYLGKAYLAGAIALILIVWMVAVPLRIAELVEKPPHGTDARIVELVEAMGLSNAVVALEKDYYMRGTQVANYRMLRSGYWTMSVPFERSEVIYIAKVPGWLEKAQASWPDRSIYLVSEAPEPLRIELVAEPREPAP